MFSEKNTNRQTTKFRSNFLLVLAGFLMLSGLVLIGLRSRMSPQGSVLGENVQNEEFGNFQIATGSPDQLDATSTLPGFEQGTSTVDAVENATSSASAAPDDLLSNAPAETSATSSPVADEEGQSESPKHESVPMVIVEPVNTHEICTQFTEALRDSPALVVEEKRGSRDPSEVTVRFKNVRHYLVTGSALQVMLSNTADFSNATAVPYEKILDWTLPEGAEDAIVQAKLFVPECEPFVVTGGFLKGKLVNSRGEDEAKTLLK